MKYVILLLFFSSGLAAQNKIQWDTTRYQKFKSNLIIGVFQSYRNFNNQFSQTHAKDSTGITEHNFMAESKLVTGFEITYDKFSLSLGLRSTPQENSAGKGNTKTFNFNFNVGGNIWFMENSVRYFKGFYDANTVRYDSAFKETGKYFLQPNFTNTLVRSKFLFFTNHKKFSFRSNYACNYRQLKSAFTWIFSASTIYNYMNNDSSFFPAVTRASYGDKANLNGLKVFGISGNAGAAATLVLWRAFFVNLLFTMGPDHQWRQYDYPGKRKNLAYISLSGDFRGSIGLNFKRCYLVSYSSNEFVIYDSSIMKLTNKSLTGGFILGWRLHSHTPELYKKFQKSKLYAKL